MKASKYNILIDNPDTDETVLYNSLYGSLSVWERDEIGITKQILANPNDANFSEGSNSQVKNLLVEQKNLLDDSTDELSIIENRKWAGIKDQNRLDAIIMPTFDCNFACTYCYEKHFSSLMTEQTEAAIVQWLTKEMPRHKVTLLSWFGGEPLIGHKRVVSITQKALSIAQNAGTSLVSHMTTNGYLLNDERIKQLMDVEIFDYQITLDGSPATHDKLRVLKNGGGTFERIFSNVISLVRADDRVRVSLRVNFNHSNFHTIPSLLEKFPSIVRPHIRVIFEPIFGHCLISATDNISSDEISDSMADYYRLAKQLGYDVVLGLSGIQTGKLVYCYAERESQFIINYNGDVHKCSVCDFTREERVGYINPTGVFVEEPKWHTWVGNDLFEQKCHDCAYLPLCMGGCRKTRLSNNETGSYCALVPTNASYLLKQIAWGNFANIMRAESGITK